MPRLNLLEIESLEMNNPSASELRKGVKRKCIGKRVLSINTELVASVASGPDLEFEDETTETTEICMMDESFHIVPCSYRKFIEQVRAS